jgi:hypothetical protein
MIGRGVVAWMRAWPPAPVSVERRQVPSVADDPPLPLYLHRDVALILTNMLLNGERASLEATA